jgi:FMN reductase
MPEVLTIAGSPSKSSRSSAVLKYLRWQLEQRNLRTWNLEVRDLPPADLLYGHYDSPAIKQAASLVAQARAIVIATPVYKASFSGALKTFLDLLPQHALQGKLILPIATGGSPNHMLAIDYALRPVLASLGAHNVLQGIYIVDSQLRQEQDRISFDLDVAERLGLALNALSDGLVALEEPLFI